MSQIVYKKLLEVKKRVPYLQKDKKGYNYTYTSPSALFATVNPLLNEAGLLLITHVINSTSMAIETGTGNKIKTEWKYDLDFIFEWVDVDTAEKVAIPWKASGVNGDDKGLGSALTYAERYFVMKQFNIPTDDDDPDSFQDRHMPEVDKKVAAAEKKAAAEAEKLAADAVKAEQAQRNLNAGREKLKAATTLAELAAAYKALGPEGQAALVGLKNELKAKLATPAATTA